LTQNHPPKGDATAWKKQTKEMLEAAKASVKDEKDAGAKLFKLVNCKTCHETFKAN
jgi:hypothetical protein